MNDRPQRNDRSERDPRDRNERGARKSYGNGREDRPQRSYDRNDRPQRSYGGGREDRPQRSYDRNDRPQRSYDRNDRPQREDRGGQRGGYDRNDRSDGQKRSYDRNDRPQRDDRGGQRGGYDRNDRQQRDSRGGERDGYEWNNRPPREDRGGQRGSYDRSDRPQRSFDRNDRGDGPKRSFNRSDRPHGSYDRNDRSQRPSDRSDAPKRSYDRSDRPQRDDRGGQRGGYDRNDRPQRSFDRNDRSDGPKRSFDRSDRPQREDRSGQRGGYDRSDRPQRSYDRNDRPQRDDRSGQRGGYDGNDRPQRSYDRNDGPRRSFDRSDHNDRPQRDDRGGQRGGFNRSDRPQRDHRGGQRGGYDRNDRPQRSFDRDDRGGRPQRRDNDRGRSSEAPYGRGGTRGGGRSDRGGAAREFTEAERLQHELRPVRAEHDDPVLPEEVQPRDLHPAARNELKTLQVDVQERVARHLAMVAFLIDEDPELAHQHALSASRRAGRIPVTRETLAITAYRTGDFALALRELRTYRRLSGLDNHVALMVDCERGLERPEKAIETGLAADTSALDTEQRVHLAIAMSGARLDLGQTQQALFELEIPELNPSKAFSWSSHLFGAYAAVLEDLGREREAAEWQQRSEQAANAVQDHVGSLDELEVFEIFETEEEPVGDSPEEATELDNEDPAISELTQDDERGTTDTDEDPSRHSARSRRILPADEVADDAHVVAAESDPEVSTHSVRSTGGEETGEELSIEDEVDELLAEAGIVDSAETDTEQADTEQADTEQDGSEQETK